MASSPKQCKSGSRILFISKTLRARETINSFQRLYSRFVSAVIWCLYEWFVKSAALFSTKGQSWKLLTRSLRVMMANVWLAAKSCLTYRKTLKLSLLRKQINGFGRLLNLPSFLSLRAPRFHASTSICPSLSRTFSTSALISSILFSALFSRGHSLCLNFWFNIAA